MLNKALLTISIGLFPALAGAQAQVTFKGPDNIFSHVKTHAISGKSHIAHPALQQSGMAAKTTTGNASRLVAIAFNQYNGASYDHLDSIALAYSGTRGSLYKGMDDGWELKCDNGQEYSYDMSAGAYQNNFKFTQTFDADNNIVTYLEEEWDVPTSSWKNYRQNFYTYDASHNLLTNTEQDWDATAGAWANYNRTTNTYVAATNKIATQLLEFWDASSSAWQNEYQNIYTYDGAYHLISELDKVWNSASSAWDDNFRYTYTYDASGNLSTSVGEIWQPSSAVWQNYSKELNAYNAMNNKVNKLTQIWDSAANAWLNNGNDLFSNFTGSYPGVIAYQVWNSGSAVFENSFKDSLTYNSFSQPLHDYELNWNSGSGTWEIQTGNYGFNYYYETYATAVQNISGKGVACIYPVPAKNTVSIEVVWNEPQEFTVSIIDMLGRVHSSWSVPSCTRHTETVPVNGLPAGNYFIKMKGPKDEIVQKITVEK